MDVDYAAAKIVDSILRNDNFVIIPFGYSVLYTILLRLPRSIRHHLTNYIGSTGKNLFLRLANSQWLFTILTHIPFSPTPAQPNHSPNESG